MIVCSHQAARRCMFLRSCTNGHLSRGARTCSVPLYKFGVDFHVFPRDPSSSDLHNTSSGFVPLEVKTLPLMLKFFLLCLGLFPPALNVSFPLNPPSSNSTADQTLGLSIGSVAPLLVLALLPHAQEVAQPSSLKRGGKGG